MTGPPVSLLLTGSHVVDNVASAAGGAAASGGGIFATDPFTAAGGLIADNGPDQCAGTGCPATATAARWRVTGHRVHSAGRRRAAGALLMRR